VHEAQAVMKKVVMVPKNIAYQPQVTDEDLLIALQARLIARKKSSSRFRPQKFDRKVKMGKALQYDNVSKVLHPSPQARKCRRFCVEAVT
jgi:hypothetical protein